jgi:para-nitrobenzyl esterase
MPEGTIGDRSRCVIEKVDARDIFGGTLRVGDTSPMLSVPRLWSAGALFKSPVGLLGIALLVGCSSSSSGISSGAATSPSNAMCKATVSQGALDGKSAGTTCEYLGIPFGAPPTGALRFMPPQPAAGWTGVRSATAYGPSCLQAGSALGAVGATSEDCLSVNVFTPQTPPAAKLPVMVFIYGGAFTSGSSSLYDGSGLSEAGPVVVVTMNYRLGALGFLALPDLDSKRTGAPSGSDGIRDQQLALKWVQDNAAVFNGDPTNVTVFGESAGSTSTCIHLVSPGSVGLANRYMMESGSCIGQSPELSTQAQSYQVGAELVSSFCAGDTGAALITCLQAADPAKLMTWLPPAGAPTSGIASLLGNLLGPPFSPTVEGPGGVLPDRPANLIASGSFNKDAAILAGTNENEWGLFVDLATNTLLGGSATSPLNITTAAQLNQGIETIYGASAPMVEALYPATDATAPQVFIDLVTDNAFRCPTRALARATMAQGTKDYFLYSYDIGPAWHSFELVPLFNVTELVILGATMPSPGYVKQMQGYWTQFAATGTPNGAASAPVMWPAYTTAGDQYLALEDPTPMAIANLRQAQCDFWDTFKATPLAPTDGGTPEAASPADAGADGAITLVSAN